MTEERALIEIANQLVRLNQNLEKLINDCKQTNEKLKIKKIDRDDKVDIGSSGFINTNNQSEK